MSDDREDEGVAGGGSNTPLFVLFGILFFPALIVAVVLYGMLRWGRLRPLIIGSVATVLGLIAVGSWFIGDALGSIMKWIGHWEQWTLLLPLAVSVNLILGAIVGFAVVSWEVRQMEKNPHRVLAPGSWSYKFKFRATPTEIMKRHKIIKELKSGALNDDERAPLGIHEADEASTVYRYYTEAFKHTFMLGTSGSGKALHWETKIPTPSGMKIVREIKVGDFILDEFGNPTKVLSKYCPHDPESYEITFNNRQKVKVSAGHLWTVIDCEDNELTLPTADIVSKGSDNFRIRMMQGEAKNDHQSVEQRLWVIKKFALHSKSVPRGFIFSTHSLEHANELRVTAASLGWATELIRGHIYKVVVRSPEKDSVGEDFYYFTKMTKIDENPAHFFCFEVDSPNSLFLCTESFIPTHNTKTMQTLIRNDIVTGKSVVIIDMKRSPKFAAAMARFAKDSGREFYHFVNGDEDQYDIEDSPGQAFYDPLRAGSITSKADMVLGMREFDAASEIYKVNLNQVLQVTFAMLKYANKNHPALETEGFFDSKGRRVYDTAEFANRAEIKAIIDKEISQQQAKIGKTASMSFNPVAYLKDRGLLVSKTIPRIDWDHGGIYQLATAISGNNLEFLSQACVGTQIEGEAMEFGQLLDKKLAAGKGIREAVAELQGQMRTIIASEYGQWLRTSPDDSRSIDLFKLTRKPAVVMFSLNSDSEKEFSKFIGSLIMADITNVSARRRNKGLNNPVMIYVDEFQALNPSSVSGLLEKSRESFMAATIAQQSFEQVVSSTSNNGEAYLRSIIESCSNFIIHAGMEKDSAERMSRLFGKHYVTTYKVTNKHKGFFLSNNWRNRRDQVVTTDREEVWQVPPEEFLKLSLPDKSNNFKATAVIINKTCAEEKFSGKGGAVARTTHIIPPHQVIEEYYHSDEDSEAFSSENGGLVAELHESPIAALFAEVEKPDDSDDYVYDDDDDEDYSEEDLDGGFDFEDLSEEDVEVNPSTFSSQAHSQHRPTSDSQSKNEEIFNEFDVEDKEDDEMLSFDVDNLELPKSAPLARNSRVGSAAVRDESRVSSFTRIQNARQAAPARTKEGTSSVKDSKSFSNVVDVESNKNKSTTNYGGSQQKRGLPVPNKVESKKNSSEAFENTARNDKNVVGEDESDGLPSLDELFN